MSRPYHRGIAYVHVGTHKTGTTSIQALLAMNDDPFQAAGVFVPRSGRLSPECAGHHNVAWELAGHPQFDARRGTFGDLLDEVTAVAAPAVCLTSEDFEFLAVNPAALRTLRDGLLDAGYDPYIVLYLRPQADYLESAYAQVIRECNIAFEDYLESMISNGRYGALLFEYDRLTSAFANVFGREHMIVRAYRAAAPAAKLLRDFTRIVAPAKLNFARLALPGRLNPMATFCDVVATRERQLDCTAHHTIGPDQQFDPLSLLDVVRIIARFWHANDALRRSYGVRIGCVTRGTLARELLTELLRDRESRHRKRLIRSLVESEPVQLDERARWAAIS